MLAVVAHILWYVSLCAFSVGSVGLVGFLVVVVVVLDPSQDFVWWWCVVIVVVIVEPVVDAFASQAVVARAIWHG